MGKGIKKLIFITSLCLFLSIFSTSYGGHFRGNGEWGYTLESDDFYVALEVGYQQTVWWFYIELYGGIEVKMEKGRSVFFEPYSDDYYVGAVIGRGTFYTKIEHHCMHPVLAKRYGNTWFMNEKMYENSCTRIGAGFKF